MNKKCSINNCKDVIFQKNFNTYFCQMHFLKVSEDLKKDIQSFSTPSGRMSGQGCKPFSIIPFFEILKKNEGTKITTQYVMKMAKVSYPTARRKMEFFERKGIVKFMGNGTWIIETEKITTSPMEENVKKIGGSI